MALTLVECTDKEQWNHFTDESPHGSVFCLTPFLDALGEQYRLLLVEEAGKPQAGVVIILRDGQPYPGQYPFTIYQGIVLGSSLCGLPPWRRVQQTTAVVNFLLMELQDHFDRICLCLHHRFEDLRSFGASRGETQTEPFQIALQYSGLLDLGQVAEFDGYLRSIRELRRREYRRCRANGFQIRSSGDVDLLDQLHRLTFARQGIERDPNVVRLLRSISRAALEQRFGELLTCTTPDGTITSATLFLFDRHCAYYWVGANDPAYRKTGSATYLMIENIRHWQQMGLRELDFVGINSPKRGDFKTSFNAVPARYFLATWERPKRADSALHPGAFSAPC